MTYTIKEASDITGIPATTLRYYDKEGILPFLERKESGHRMFSEQDLSMLRIIECLKCTGMSIKDIRQYAALVQQMGASPRKAASEQQMGASPDPSPCST